jgi:hypothetical protein
MWTKVLSWDQKWFYLVTHFVKKGAKINPSDITLYPKQRRNLSDDSAPSSRRGSDTSTTDGKGAVAATAVSKIVFKDGRKTILPNTMLELSGLMPQRNQEKAVELDDSYKDLANQSRRPSSDESGWSWEKMEAERLRGLEVAQHLAEQTGMENEFTHDVALGRHYDGYGVEGVVSTLAQLAGLNKYQLL